MHGARLEVDEVRIALISPLIRGNPQLQADRHTVELEAATFVHGQRIERIVFIEPPAIRLERLER